MLHSLNSYSSHLIPPIHQASSRKSRYLDTFHDLPVQGCVVVASDPHLVLHLLLPPLVMVKRMDPQNRICLISSYPLIKMFTSSCESISSCFSFVCTDFLATDLAENVIRDTLSPAISSFHRFARKAFWPSTLFVRPRISPS